MSDDNSEVRGGSDYYAEVISAMKESGGERIGFMSSFGWGDDPRRLVFTLSRYKFVAKMLEGLPEVLEVGCGDGFGTRVVAQAVGNVKAVDFDPDFIKSAKACASSKYKIEFDVHDMLSSPVAGQFSAAYCLDVLEHISPDVEKTFLKNILACLRDDGVLIVGMPSLESQEYASHFSKLGHVNCKTQPELRTVLGAYFANVFIFSMNDEVVHTGFGKMSHYNIALCCGPRTLS